jgi:hypothetical protein
LRRWRFYDATEEAGDDGRRRSVSGQARADHQFEARAGAARRHDRLGLDRSRNRAALQRQGSARDRDPVCDRAAAAQAHLWIVRRRRVRALGLRPILPALHGREVFPARVSARAFGSEPLAEAAWRQAGSSPGRELAGGACKRRATDPRPQTGYGGYHRPAQEHHLPDRRQAVACGDQWDRPTGQKARGAVAAILSAHRQARRDDGGALCPRQAVQTPPSATAPAAHPARPHHPRRPTQDRRPRRDRSGVGMAARARQPDPLATATPTRVEALFLPRSRRSSVLARARRARLTSSASRLRSLPPTPAPRVGNSCCTPKRSRATPTTATR